MNQKPFAHLVQAEGATVYRVCLAMLGPGPDAEDVWSETFLAALEKWDRPEQIHQPQAWLVRVAQRKAIDVMRKRARHAVPYEEVPLQPAQAAFDLETELSMWEAFELLSERQRQAVLYHYWCGLPHEQTAAILGGTSAAVRRACADGIKRLRQHLTDVVLPKQLRNQGGDQNEV